MLFSDRGHYRPAVVQRHVIQRNRSTRNPRRLNCITVRTCCSTAAIIVALLLAAYAFALRRFFSGWRLRYLLPTAPSNRSGRGADSDGPRDSPNEVRREALSLARAVEGWSRCA